MSGFPDDRFDDPRPDPRAIEEARSAARLPATLLIVVGVLTLLGAVINLITLPGFPAKIDEFSNQIENDPNFPAAEKKQWKDVLDQMKELAEGPTFWIAYAASAGFALVILIGGLKMLNLSGVALPTISAVLAMIPCTSGCCCIVGLPAGIWALVILNRPAVRAAIAANRATPTGNPDDPYAR